VDVLGTIESLDDALRLTAPNCAALDSLRGEHFGSHPRDARELWFRGQSSAKWSLKPSLDRQIEADALPPEIEHTIYVDFRRSEALTRAFKISSILDVLCLMQHYGIPTRTLDWSTNVGVGLYFAVQDCLETQVGDGALYVLNPRRLNWESTGVSVIHLPESGPVEARGWMISDPTLPSVMHYFSDHRPSYKAEIEEGFNRNSPTRDAYMEQCRLPVAVAPDMITDRMRAQDAMLVIHGGTHKTIEGGFGRPILLDEVNSGMGKYPCLAKLLVPGTAKDHIWGELMRIGIHRARLFPELEHQALHLWEQAVDSHKVLETRERNKPRIPGITEFTGF
jgi:hypothetical protein